MGSIYLVGYVLWEKKKRLTPEKKVRAWSEGEEERNYTCQFLSLMDWVILVVTKSTYQQKTTTKTGLDISTETNKEATIIRTSGPPAAGHNR